MKKNLRIIMIFLFLWEVSCAGNAIVQDVSMESDGTRVVKTESVQQTSPFILGPGDEIVVKVWRNDDLTRQIQLDPSGNLQFPLVGEIKASGLTVAQLRMKMASLLSEYIVDPQVDINLSRTTERSILPAPLNGEWACWLGKRSLKWGGLTEMPI